MKKIITLLLVAVLPYISGCFLLAGLDCGNPDWKPFFEIEKGYFRFYEFSTNPKPNSYYADSVKIMGYPKEISFQYDVNYLSEVHKNSIDNVFMPIANACSPKESGSEGLKKSIDKINIVTLFDYDKHKKGSSMNDLIYVGGIKIDSFSTKLSTSKSKIGVEGFDLFIDHSGIKNKFDLNNLSYHPFQLKIDISYKDGTSTTAQTQLIFCEY
jgi:hypothetical protein